MPTNGTYVERLLNYKRIRQATHLQYDEKKQIIACHAKAWQCLFKTINGILQQAYLQVLFIEPIPVANNEENSNTPSQLQIEDKLLSWH